MLIVHAKIFFEARKGRAIAERHGRPDSQSCDLSYHHDDSEPGGGGTKVCALPDRLMSFDL